MTGTFEDDQLLKLISQCKDGSLPKPRSSLALFEADAQALTLLLTILIDDVWKHGYLATLHEHTPTLNRKRAVVSNPEPKAFHPAG